MNYRNIFVHTFRSRDVPGLGIYMVTYEHACCLLKTLLYNEAITNTKKGEMPKHIQLLSGGIAGINCMFYYKYE